VTRTRPATASEVEVQPPGGGSAGTPGGDRSQAPVATSKAAKMVLGVTRRWAQPIIRKVALRYRPPRRQQCQPDAGHRRVPLA
jgi:hypothetical protein